jgi:primosomal protein N' (replication factor Y)
MYALVAFNKPIEPLTYELKESADSVLPGMRVRVGLRNQTETGIIYKITEKTDITGLKPILEILDDFPVLNSDLIQLGEWIAKHYLCSVGEALWTIVPKGYKKREKTVLWDRGTDGVDPEEEFTLTTGQRAVLQQLRRSLEGDERRHFLLFGVTGSGKTEIYLRVIHEVLRKGKGAILLVPEISLTPQTVRYFSRRMGNELALLHSRLTRAEKINEWYKILHGEKKVVIGARSAVFAPIERIGIIIIDEEHETSYKSDETPRYHTRSVAYYRAMKHGATLLLGSATPSVETFYLAKMQKFSLLHLPYRVLNQQLPKTHVADLRKLRGQRFIAAPLQKAIERRLKHGEQVILFLNRRGFSPYVYCENCGYTFKCKNCDITLTYHRNEKKLTCHYCGYSEQVPDVCPICGDERILYSGFGTEKIEQVLNEYFPGAVIVRMDTDTVKKRTAIAEILSAFERKQIDILIGTQIVTKGLHFPDVTLVGVLNADIPLNFPDFRSAERTFNLITQVSGRAGRSEKGGEVIIQTYNPSHYAIQTAKTQDYEEFFVREMRFRESLMYPPFCRIVRLVFRGVNSKDLFESAYFTVSYLQEKTKRYSAILGPTLCPFSRIKNYYRVHVIIKLHQISPLLPYLRELREIVSRKRGQYLEIDVDPVTML